MMRDAVVEISGATSLLQATWNVLPLFAVLSPALASVVISPKWIAAVGETSQADTSVASTVTVLLVDPAAIATPAVDTRPATTNARTNDFESNFNI
jgi:hypothetical protein